MGSNSNDDLIDTYVKDMKADFKRDIVKSLQMRVKARQSWSSILRHLKMHISKTLEATDDYKTLKDLLENDKGQLNEIENSIVNKTYKIVKPFVERHAKEEKDTGPARPKYPAKLLKKSFALQYLTRRKPSSGAPSSRTPQRNKSATMNNRSHSHAVMAPEPYQPMWPPRFAKKGTNTYRNTTGISALRNALNDL